MKKHCRQEQGSVLVEYFILMGLIIVAVMIALPEFGQTVSGKLEFEFEPGCSNAPLPPNGPLPPSVCLIN